MRARALSLARLLLRLAFGSSLRSLLLSLLLSHSLTQVSEVTITEENPHISELTLILRIPSGKSEDAVRKELVEKKWPTIVKLCPDVRDNWVVSFKNEDDTKNALKLLNKQFQDQVAAEVAKGNVRAATDVRLAADVLDSYKITKIYRSSRIHGKLADRTAINYTFSDQGDTFGDTFDKFVGRQRSCVHTRTYTCTCTRTRTHAQVTHLLHTCLYKRDDDDFYLFLQKQKLDVCMCW
jgi:hypothetical protein